MTATILKLALVPLKVKQAKRAIAWLHRARAAIERAESEAFRAGVMLPSATLRLQINATISELGRLEPIRARRVRR